MLAPLLVQPFLAKVPHENVTKTTAESQEGITMATQTFESVVAIVTGNEGPLIQHGGFSHNTSMEVVTVRDEDRREDETTSVKYAYWIAAVYCCLIGVFLIAICYKSGCICLRPKSEVTGQKDPKRDVSKLFVATVAGLFFFFNIFLAGIEVGYAGLLVTFAVNHLQWTKNHATWVTALQQAANCVVTASCIPVSRWVSPQKLVALDLVLLNVVLILEAVFVEQYPAVLWICTAGVGAGYAIVMPSSLTWLNSFLEVSGKLSSVYWAGYFVGFMAVPAISGWLFNHVHPLWFVYMTLGCAVGMAIFFIILSAVVLRNKNGSSKKVSGQEPKVAV